MKLTDSSRLQFYSYYFKKVIFLSQKYTKSLKTCQSLKYESNSYVSSIIASLLAH